MPKRQSVKSELADDTQRGERDSLSAGGHRVGAGLPTPAEASPHPIDTLTTPQKNSGTPKPGLGSRISNRGGRGKGSCTTDGHERGRDFLERDEIKILLRSASRGRHGVRNRLLVMMMYQHGLRVSEAVRLRIDDVNLKTSRVWIRRVKGSLSTQQPIPGEELRAIKRYLERREDDLPWLFVSERGAQMTRQAVNYLIERAAKRAGLGRVYPHMLRHSCGYYLTNKGTDFRLTQDYLGHRDPKHTTRYTRVAGRRFEGLWE